jgi:hypothetical protein
MESPKSSTREMDPVKEVAKALVPQLYADIKAWTVSLGRRVRRFARNTSLREFNSPGELLEAELSRRLLVPFSGTFSFRR